ncbi:hypothetical protein [Streptomyces sp. NPDC059072]|uniref:hypothetical protein n=1 Tax=Streptomyces sp. NPDC059072 TaxID=3346715 RepID=UPI0036A21F35
MRPRLDGAEDGLRRLLNEWDPIGVAEDADVRDEYDCMLAPLLRMLRGGADQTAIASFLLHDLEDHFGLTPRSSEPEAMAARVISWWTAAGNASGRERGERGEAVGGAGGWRGSGR